MHLIEVNDDTWISGRHYINLDNCLTVSVLMRNAKYTIVCNFGHYTREYEISRETYGQILDHTKESR